jgi:hypothetical protein
MTKNCLESSFMKFSDETQTVGATAFPSGVSYSADDRNPKVQVGVP